MTSNPTPDVLSVAYHRPLFGETPEQTEAILTYLENSADDLYIDAEGKDAPREQLRAMLDRIRDHDGESVVVLWGLERLGRSFSHCVSILANLGEDGAAVCIVDPDNALTLPPRPDPAVVALNRARRALSSERALIGAHRAHAIGTVLGRRPVLTDDDRAEICRRLETGEPYKALAEFFGVSVSTIRRARDAFLAQRGLTIDKVRDAMQ